MAFSPFMKLARPFLRIGLLQVRDRSGRGILLSQFEQPRVHT